MEFVDFTYFSGTFQRENRSGIEDPSLSYMSPKCLLIELYAEVLYFCHTNNILNLLLSSLKFFTAGVQKIRQFFLSQALPVTRYFAITLKVCSINYYPFSTSNPNCAFVEVCPSASLADNYVMWYFLHSNILIITT